MGVIAAPFSVSVHLFPPIPFPAVTKRSHFIIKLHFLVTCLCGAGVNGRAARAVPGHWIPAHIEWAPAGFTLPSGTETLLAQHPLHIPAGPFQDRILFRGAFIISQFFGVFLTAGKSSSSSMPVNDPTIFLLIPAGRGSGCCQEQVCWPLLNRASVNKL